MSSPISFNPTLQARGGGINGLTNFYEANKLSTLFNNAMNAVQNPGPDQLSNLYFYYTSLSAQNLQKIFPDLNPTVLQNMGAQATAAFNTFFQQIPLLSYHQYLIPGSVNYTNKILDSNDNPVTFYDIIQNPNAGYFYGDANQNRQTGNASVIMNNAYGVIPQGPQTACIQALEAILHPHG